MTPHARLYSLVLLALPLLLLGLIASPSPDDRPTPAPSTFTTILPEAPLVGPSPLLQIPRRDAFYLVTFTETTVPNGDPAGVDFEIPVDKYGRVLNLTFWIQMPHEQAGDLRFDLESPSGTKVTFFNQPPSRNDPTNTPGSCTGNLPEFEWLRLAIIPNGGGPWEDVCNDDPLSAYDSNIFDSPELDAFLNEEINGTWILTVADVNGSNTETASFSQNTFFFVKCQDDPDDNCFNEPQLPVELTSFDVVTTEDGAVLRWETATETNNAGFEVQHRASATGGYAPLDFVPGYGTTSVPQRYTHTVPGLGVGTHTFRLKQVDFDGAFEYSPEVEVQLEVAGTYHVSAAYPNPFNPQTTWTLAVAQPQQVLVEVVNALGQRVALLHNDLLSAHQAHTFTFEAAHLPSGTYLIRATGAHFQATRQVTLSK